MDPAQLRMKLDPVENGLTNCQVWSQPNKGYSGYQNAVQSIPERVQFWNVLRCPHLVQTAFL